MTPSQIAAILDGLIPIAGGILITLLGYRIIGKKKGESLTYDLWHERFAFVFKIGGPVLIVLGVILAMINVARVE